MTSTVRITDTLVERLQLILPALILCAGAIVLQWLFKADSLSRIPFVGAEIGGQDKRRIAYLTNAKNIYKDGYQKFKDRICRMTTVQNTEIVIVSPSFLPELKKLPDDMLSMAKAIDEFMETKYTKVQAEQPLIVHTVKANLTPSLIRLNPSIADEVDKTMSQEIPSCKDWTPVNVYSKLLRIVAIVSGRVFIGPELSHDEAYIDAAINYTVDLMEARKAIQELPPWLRPLKAPSLPQVKKLDERIIEADAFLRPIVTARRKAENDPDYQKPDDMLQWMMDGEHKFGGQDDQELARSQLGLSFAAIHTTTLTATNAFYNLAAYPENIKELREEAVAVLAENGGVFTSTALQNMKKMDSFLKETLRMNPPSYSSFNRKVLKPITLSNGQVIPAGVTIEIPAYGVTRDETVFPNPDNFDSMRFFRLRERSETFNKPSGNTNSGGAALESAVHNQFVSVSPNSLTFGYGRHACPGRFFAANEIKMILARVVLKYDVRNVDGIKERYPNFEISNTSVPDPRREVLLKEV